MPLGIVGAVQELGSVLGPLLGALVLAVASWREIFWLNVVLGVVCLVGVGLLRMDRFEGGSVGGCEQQTVRSVVSLALAALAVAATALTLWAPKALTTSIALGGPFVALDIGWATRLATPIGLGAAVLWLLLALLTASRWLPLLLKADLIGAAMIAVVLGSLVLTFSTADPESEVLGAWGLWLLPLGLAAAIGFVIRQRTAANPLVPAGVVRRRVWPALAVSVLVGAAIVAIVVDIPLLSRLTQDTNETDAALVLVRFLVAVPVGAIFGGWLLRRVGPALVAAPGLALAAAAILAMGQWERQSLDSLVTTTVVLAAAGFGVGLAIAPVNDAALADAREDGHGTVSSLVVVARMTGMVVGLAVLTAWGLRRFHAEVATLADPTDADAVLEAAVVQVQTVLTGAGVAASVAAVIALTLGTRPVRDASASDQTG